MARCDSACTLVLSLVKRTSAQALVGSLDSACNDAFDEQNSEEFGATEKEFWKRTEELETDCVTFLDTRFTRLRSALSAFQMLKDFTTTASRPKINMKLGEKFVDILHHFSMPGLPPTSYESDPRAVPLFVIPLL